MNQKERDEAFRRGQNSNTGEHHTEEEWRKGDSCGGSASGESGECAVY